MKTQPRIFGSLLSLLLMAFSVSAVWANQRSLENDGNGGYYINMPATGTDTLVISDGVTTFKVYDDGGPNETFSAGCEGFLLLTAPEGRLLRLAGSIKTNYYSVSVGYLTVYDGVDANAGYLLYDYGNVPNLRKKLSTQENMFLQFRGSGDHWKTEYEGLELTITIVDPNGPHAINIETAEHGGFVNPPATAMPGEVVTLTASPEEGYFFDWTTIQDEYGEYMEYTGSWYTNNVISFVMPQTDITISPTFNDPTYRQFSLRLDPSGTENMVIPDGMKSFVVSAGYTSESIDSYVSITAPEGKFLQMVGAVSERSALDSLYVYNGSDTLLKAPKGASIERMVVPSSNLTIHYKEIGEHVQDGYAFTLIFVVVDPDKEYNISFGDYSHGSVTSNLTSAKINTPVSLLVTPDPGYYLQNIRIIGEASEMDAAKTGGTWYSTDNDASFLMPGEDVFIEPIFVSETEKPRIAVSWYETIRATIPAGIEEFYVDGQGVGEWEAAKPLILTAPEGYLFKVEDVNDEYSSEFNAFDGDFADPVGSDIELMSGITSGRYLTLVYVGTGEYDKSIPVKLIDASQPHYINAQSSSSGSGEIEVVNYSYEGAPAGARVKVVAHPDQGYMFSGARVLNDYSWTDLDVEIVEDSIWFTMPFADVRIIPAFAAVDEPFFNMPKRGSYDVAFPKGVESIWIYDDGGQWDYYGEKSNGVLTLTVPEGFHLKINTINIETGGEKDVVSIYDGADTNAPKIMTGYGYNENEVYEPYASNEPSFGRSLTFHFKSDGRRDYREGFEIQVSIANEFSDGVRIPKTGTESKEIPEGISSFDLFDDGGYDDDYSDNSDGVLTLTAPEGYVFCVYGDAGFDKNDFLTVHDGADTNAMKIATMYDDSWLYIYSTGRSITFHFKSDESGNSGGMYFYVDVVKKIKSYTAVNVYEDIDDGWKWAVIDGAYSGNEAIDIPESIEVNSIEFNREFTPYTPATVVLPFSLPKSASFNDAKFYYLKKVEQEGSSWMATMKWIGAGKIPQANTPYVIIPSDEALYINIPYYYGETATLQTAPIEPQYDASGNWYFTGTYAYRAWKSDDSDLGLAYGFAGTNEDGISQGEFGKIGTGATAFPMQAYLMKNDASVQLTRPTPRPYASNENNLMSSIDVGILPESIDVKFVDEEEKTMAIGRMNTVTGKIQIDRWVDTKGRRLEGKPTIKGTYFNNHKRVIVK